MLDLGPENGYSLADTLCGGQSFRWREAAPGVWRGAAGAYAAELWAAGGHLWLRPLGPAAPEGWWQRYLALDLDYPAMQRRFCANRRLADCVAAAPGIRVLRQPFFEALCAFILSQNNNIGRITGIVARLCALCGAPLAEGLYAFPTPAALAAQTEASLAVLRAGWRAAYLLDAARRVADGRITQELLLSLPQAEARALLMTVRGVGPKVADCVLLYGLGRWRACPMDVWMKRAMKTLFPRGMPCAARGREGIAQQYIFAYARKNLPRGDKSC
mgnify:CR=1 FL=1